MINAKQFSAEESKQSIRSCQALSASSVNGLYMLVSSSAYSSSRTSYLRYGLAGSKNELEQLALKFEQNVKIRQTIDWVLAQPSYVPDIANAVYE